VGPLEIADAVIDRAAALIPAKLVAAHGPVFSSDWFIHVVLPSGNGVVVKHRGHGTYGGWETRADAYEYKFVHGSAFPHGAAEDTIERAARTLGRLWLSGR
jgi:hypothetical protein